jgi:hypothetical protein
MFAVNPCSPFSGGATLLSWGLTCRADAASKEVGDGATRSEDPRHTRRPKTGYGIQRHNTHRQRPGGTAAGGAATHANSSSETRFELGWNTEP